MPISFKKFTNIVAVSGQLSAFSGQRSAFSGQLLAGCGSSAIIYFLTALATAIVNCQEDVIFEKYPRLLQEVGDICSQVYSFTFQDYGLLLNVAKAGICEADIIVTRTTI